MAGPDQDFDGELVLLSDAEEGTRDEGGPRVVRYPGDPNGILDRPAGTLCMDTLNGGAWSADVPAFSWTRASAGGFDVPPANDDTTVPQGVGILLFDLPNDPTPPTFARRIEVTQKIEIVNAWCIKTGEEGDDGDNIVVQRQNGGTGIPDQLATFNFDGVTPDSQSNMIGDDYPGINFPFGLWSTSNLVLEVGDYLTLTQLYQQNNAGRIYLLVVRRT